MDLSVEGPPLKIPIKYIFSPSNEVTSFDAPQSYANSANKPCNLVIVNAFQCYLIIAMSKTCLMLTLVTLIYVDV